MRLEVTFIAEIVPIKKADRSKCCQPFHLVGGRFNRLLPLLLHRNHHRRFGLQR